jgi:UDP-N-acetylmuramate-alanine ligase
MNGYTIDFIKLKFDTFTNVSNRMEYIKTIGLNKIYSDHAIHPTEVKATLDVLINKKILVIWRPHKNERLHYTFDNWINVFNNVNSLIITNIIQPKKTEYDILPLLIDKINIVNKKHIDSDKIKYYLEDMEEQYDMILFLCTKYNDII